jgi:hypothetical protein
MLGESLLTAQHVHKPASSSGIWSPEQRLLLIKAVGMAEFNRAFTTTSAGKSGNVSISLCSYPVMSLEREKKFGSNEAGRCITTNSAHLGLALAILGGHACKNQRIRMNDFTYNAIPLAQ